MEVSVVAPGMMVEYCEAMHKVRLQLNDKVIVLAVADYKLLWGALTEGLDELERMEDASGFVESNVELNHAALSGIALSQTRH